MQTANSATPAPASAVAAFDGLRKGDPAPAWLAAAIRVAWSAPHDLAIT
jgi:hypothetical protein